MIVIYEMLRDEVWCVGIRKKRAFQRIKSRLSTIRRSLCTIVSKLFFLKYLGRSLKLALPLWQNAVSTMAVWGCHSTTRFLIWAIRSFTPKCATHILLLSSSMTKLLSFFSISVFTQTVTLKILRTQTHAALRWNITVALHQYVSPRKQSSKNQDSCLRRGPTKLCSLADFLQLWKFSVVLISIQLQSPTNLSKNARLFLFFPATIATCPRNCLFLFVWFRKAQKHNTYRSVSIGEGSNTSQKRHMYLFSAGPGKNMYFFNGKGLLGLTGVAPSIPDKVLSATLQKNIS